jgi:hypothetical protein
MEQLFDFLLIFACVRRNTLSVRLSIHKELSLYSEYVTKGINMSNVVMYLKA